MPTKSSVAEPDNLAVELVDEFSDLTTFKLLPVYNYQTNNNGLIINGDEVYIVSCCEETKGSYDPCLNVSREVSAQDGGLQAYRELNVTVEKVSSFKISIFSNYLDNFEDNLKINDIIGLTQSELGLGLISVGYTSVDDQRGRLALREEGDKMSNLSGNSNGMYRLENFDGSSQGGFVVWGRQYRLKHIA